MLFVQLLSDGLVTGLAVGLLAASFSLIYSTTGVFHVAHAGVYTLGGYLAWFGAIHGVPFVLAVAGSALAAAAFGVLMQRYLYRPLAARKATPLVLLIASLGALAMLQNAIAMLFTPDILQFPNPWRVLTASLGGVTWSYAQILVVVVSLPLFGGLVLLSEKTRLGRRIRAVASNPLLAEMTRLRPHSVHMAVMAIGSGIAAVAGALVGLDQALQPYTGVLALLTATIAVIAGGIGSLGGAYVVSIGLSALQNVLLVTMPGRWTIAVTFGLFIAFILVKPQGLFRR